MKIRAHKNSKETVFYCMLICLAAFLQTFLAAGMASSTFSTYLPYIKIQHHLTDSAGALIITIRTISIMLSLIIIDKYIAFLNLRKAMLFTGLFAAVGFLIFSFSSSDLLLYISAIFLGLSNGFGGTATVSILINRWFRDSKAFVLGIASAGSGIAIIVLPGLIAFSTEHFGLNVAFRMEAFMVLILTLIIYILVRNSPEELSVEPWTSSASASVRKTTSRPKESLSTPAFSLLCFAMLAMGAAGTLASFLTLLYTSNGYTPVQATSIFSAVGLVLTFGKLFIGWLSDKIGGLKCITITYLLNIIGTICCAFGYTHNNILLIVAVVFSGLGWTIATVGINNIAILFSTESQFDHYIEHFQFFYTLGMLSSTYVVGLLADLTGGYFASYIFIAALILLSLFIILLLYAKTVVGKSLCHQT